jgi:AraC-like DNA-binding protein
VVDQDQLSLHFGYTLYHSNGDTIASPPLVNRWVIDQHKATSPRRAVCRQRALKKEIKIDGNHQDWRGFRRHRISQKARFASMWTPAAFLFLVEVDDFQVTAWDRVELHFDLHHTRTPFMDARHRLISFAPKSRSFATVVAQTDSGPRQVDSIVLRIGEEIEWRSRPRPGGYTIEARIPFCVLSDLEFPPKRFGFDVAVLDRNGGAGSHLSVATWSGVQASSRHNPSEWGTLNVRQVLLPLKILLLAMLGFAGLVVLLILAMVIRQKRVERYYRGLDRKPLSPRVQRLLDCIGIHCGEGDFTLGSAAEELGESPAELARTLSEETEATFENLLDLARTRKAKDLLRTTELPVEQIASNCGFRHTGPFLSMFGRVAGVDPRAYRAQQREEALEEEQEEEEND